MSLSIRSILPLIAATIALGFLSAPARAQSEVKVAAIVAKTLIKCDKTVLSYDRKIDRLVQKCTAKVAKMVEKEQPAELINAYIARSITTGMNHAGVTRAKISATEEAGLRALVKHGSPAAAAATIGTEADSALQEVDDLWDAAGTALHALEVPV